MREKQPTKKKSGIWNVECGIIVENQTGKRSLQNTVLAKAGEDNIILWDSQHYYFIFLLTYTMVSSDQTFFFIRLNLNRHIYLS